jgi:hypothetical protein
MGLLAREDVGGFAAGIGKELSIIIRIRNENKRPGG